MIDGQAKRHPLVKHAICCYVHLTHSRRAHFCIGWVKLPTKAPRTLRFIPPSEQPSGKWIYNCFPSSCGALGGLFSSQSHLIVNVFSKQSPDPTEQAFHTLFFFVRFVFPGALRTSDSGYHSLPPLIFIGMRTLEPECTRTPMAIC